MIDLFGDVLLAVMCFGVLLMLYLPVYLILRIGFQKKLLILRQLTWLAFVAVIIIILLVTVLTGIDFHPATHVLNLKPFQCFAGTSSMGSGKMAMQNVQNVLMFVPAGLLFPAACSRRDSFLPVFLFVFGFSFGIEFVQYFIGRVADIDDLMLNTLGGITGYGLYLILEVSFRGKKWWNKLIGRWEGIQEQA